MKLAEVRLKAEYRLPSEPTVHFTAEAYDLSLESGIVRVQKLVSTNGAPGLVNLLPFGNCVRCVPLDDKPKKESKP